MYRVFEDHLHPRRPSLLSSTEEDTKPNFCSMQLGMLRIRSGIFLSGRCVIFFLKKSRKVWRLWSFRGTTCPSPARSLPNNRKNWNPRSQPSLPGRKYYVYACVRGIAVRKRCSGCSKGSEGYLSQAFLRCVTQYSTLNPARYI